MRSRGTPEWSWTISNNTKDYITGWMTSGPEDEQWLYRLELVNVSFEVDLHKYRYIIAHLDFFDYLCIDTSNYCQSN